MTVLSGQVQFALESEMLGDEAPALLPVLGLTLTLLSVLVCAKAEPNAPITAAAEMLTASCLNLMWRLSCSGGMKPACTSQGLCQ